MKKVLLSSAAILGLAVASPALAQDNALDLQINGHYKGYVSYIDQDDAGTAETRDVDWLQETEVHLQGETTLDNGLTVGVYVEAEVDGGDSAAIDESYAYFSGAWGRVNAGDEDGAAYLLQVAAPSADSNVDGIRQFVSGFNAGNAGVGLGGEGTIDYDNDLTNDANKLTYLTPVFGGFQAGASYTPDTQATSFTGLANAGSAPNGATSTLGNASDDVAGSYGSAYEVGARYEGIVNNVGFILGAGYTYVELEEDLGTQDDAEEWNVGLDVDFGAIGVGAVYTENNNGDDVNDENDTWVVGADYTTGPFKLGASYLNNENDLGGTDTEIDRYTGGVVYTYGPGMSFRGSVSYIDAEVGGADADATNVLLGTQINF